MILALDPGLSACGWALFGGERLAGFGVITTSAGEEESVAAQDVGRVGALLAGIEEAIAKVAEGQGDMWIEAVYFEGFTAARSYRAAKAQALVLGAIGGLIHYRAAKVRTVSPARVKALVAEAVAAAQATVKPLRARRRDLEAERERCLTAADRQPLTREIDAIEAQLAPLERDRARAEKAAIQAWVVARHPGVEGQMAKLGRRAEHAADAIAIFHAADEGPIAKRKRRAKVLEGQGSLL